MQCLTCFPVSDTVRQEAEHTEVDSKVTAMPNMYCHLSTLLRVQN